MKNHFGLRASAARRLRDVLICSALAVMFVFSACGGSKNPPPPPPPTADFSLGLSPAVVSMTAGGPSATVAVAVTAVNGFAATVSVQVTGLPPGVSVQPTTITVSPGAPQQVTIIAGTNAQSGSNALTFTGTSGSLSHSAQVSLSVTHTTTLSSRTRYVRTDAFTEYSLWLNSHWIVFNPLTSRFFVTDPEGHRIHVLDAASQSKVATLDVPGAFGIDDSSDHRTLWVGTLIGDVYAIDPLTMTVKERYLASQIGPYGFAAFTALGLADGRVALLGSQGGIPSVDGSGAFAVWNPADNSVTIYTSGYGSGYVGPGIPALRVCGGWMGNFGAFTRSPDRTRIYIKSIDSDGTLCAVDPSTGHDAYVTSSGFNNIAISPDSKYIVLPAYYGEAAIYDAHTLTELARFTIEGDTSSASGFVFGSDPNVVLIPTDTMVYAYDLTTHQRVGWWSNIFVPFQAGGFVVGPSSSPFYLASDNTGMLAGPLPQGVGFLDLSAMRTGTPGTQHTNAYLDNITGPTSGGTTTSWNTQIAPLQTVLFGAQTANASLTSSGIQAVTPPGPPGPVNVYTRFADGSEQWLPDAFSYGPTILQVTTNGSTAEGGGTGYVFGYGFGPTGWNPPLPADLQVSVGGKPAAVSAFDNSAFGTGSPPFPLMSAAFAIPPGTPGAADVTVTTNSGTTLQRAAFTYFPPVQRFPLPATSLAQGIYDPYRDRYYFSDTQQLQVFSRTQGGWQAPILIPGARQLWGLALSPDGSKLAISDRGANAIHLLDPAHPTAVRTFPLLTETGVDMGPAGLAVSDQGMVYYGAYTAGVSGATGFFRLDTNTGTIKDYGIDNPGLGYSDSYLRAAISADNTRVYFNNMGQPFSIDTLTDKVAYATMGPGCCYGDYDLALSSNQTRLAASGYLYDADLNPGSYLTLSIRERQNIGYLYGMKLSPDGSLLFQPTTTGIDVFDGRIGTLRMRIGLPIHLASTFDSLVADGKDNVLLGIGAASGDGIIVIDLTSVPEPAPLPYASSAARRTAFTSYWTSQAPVRSSAAKQTSSQTYRAPTPVRVPHVITP